MFVIIVSTLFLGAAPPCGPLDLDTALALSASRSDEVAIKQADVVSAHADESLAHAARYVPNANLNFILAPSPEARGTVNQPVVGTNRSFGGLRPFGRVDVNVIQPLYTWGRLDAASEAAAAGVRGKEELATDTMSQVQFRVTQLYWGVSLARRLLALSRDIQKQLDDADRHVKKALAEGEEGIAPADQYRLDVFRAIVLGRNADAQKGLDLARIGLAATLGVTPARLVLKEAALEAPSGVMPDEASAVAAAQHQRPDLLAIEQGMAARDAEVKAERAALLPQFYFAGNFTYSYAPNRDIQLNPFISDYFNALTAGFALGFRQDFAIPTLSAKAKKAVVERNGLVRERDGLLRLVQFQVESALAELRAAEARSAATRTALNSARSLYRSAGLDFSAGLVDAKDLIEAYATYAENQGSAAQA
ncbi:MAG TPA: TolC family protein, partial [Anaeromyxobacteraceae bacterium]|nr:TolC family protein [Anaeromyxobacteraceae bacterium]